MSSPQAALALFGNSLTALAQVALRETSAAGYALFLQTAEPPGLVRVANLGDPISAEALLGKRKIPSLSVFPLHSNGAIDGFAAFAFRDGPTAVRAEKTLGRLLEAIESVWSARHLDTLHQNLAARASTLEAKLIDSRIADRTRGFLAEGPQPDVIETLIAHVRNVVRPGKASGAAEAMVQELEDELEERRVTAEAKAMLQATHSFSEEQAYTHLRMLSRKSRRRLKDVALDVIATGALMASVA